jgi:hypothetical protein
VPAKISFHPLRKLATKRWKVKDFVAAEFDEVQLRLRHVDAYLGGLHGVDIVGQPMSGSSALPPVTRFKASLFELAEGPTSRRPCQMLSDGYEISLLYATFRSKPEGERNYELKRRVRGRPRTALEPERGDGGGASALMVSGLLRHWNTLPPALYRNADGMHTRRVRKTPSQEDWLPLSRSQKAVSELPTGEAFRPEWIDFERGIRVGNIEPHERITQILKFGLEKRHGVKFVTDRWGRGVYWQNTTF